MSSIMAIDISYADILRYYEVTSDSDLSFKNSLFQDDSSHNLSTFCSADQSDCFYQV